MVNKQGQENDTNKLIQEMMKQMTTLQEKVVAIQKNPPTSESEGDSDDEMEVGTDGLVELTETTKTFLEAAFTATMSNEDCKKRVGRIGVPDCDHKGGWILIASIAILAGHSGSPGGCPREHGGRGIDARKGGSSHPNSLLPDGQCASADGTREEKKLILKLNSSLKFMVEDGKSFASAAPMLFGEEFAKAGHHNCGAGEGYEVECFFQEERSFFRLPPPKFPKWLRGWSQERLCKIPALSQRGKPDRSIIQPSRTEQPRPKDLELV